MKKALLLLVIPCVMALRFPLIAMFRSQEITNFLISLCIENQFTKILDVGPGGPEFIFPLATHAVDYRQFVFPDSSNVTQLVVDIDQDRLPFPDKYFDFVYSRHVLEDLHNPMWVFKEMTRISRIGYVETPSPSGELVHHNDLPYLGSIHHRFFLWTNPDDNSLNILPKYAILEYLTQQPLFQSMYTRATSILKSNMVLWNNYYLWSDFDPSHQAKFHLHQHEIGGYDLRNTESYLRLIYEGMEKSQTSTSNFILGAQIELQESPEYDEEMK